MYCHYPVIAKPGRAKTTSPLPIMTNRRTLNDKYGTKGGLMLFRLAPKSLAMRGLSGNRGVRSLRLICCMRSNVGIVRIMPFSCQGCRGNCYNLFRDIGQKPSDTKKLSGENAGGNYVLLWEPGGSGTDGGPEQKADGRNPCVR